MNPSPPPEFLAGHLAAPALPPDPHRLSLLVAALAGRCERPGQVLGLFHSDCGLTRAWWQEVQSGGRANLELTLHEALVTRSRPELRAWVAAQAATAKRQPADAAQQAAAERRRVHSLRRALTGDHLFAAAWDRFDPGTDTERGVLGVRGSFERYLLVLRERIFLANLGVLEYALWFRGPLETIEGLQTEPLRLALEERWNQLARYFPAADQPESAWAAAHQAAGDLFPAADAIERQRHQILRRAGLIVEPTHPLHTARA